MIRMMIRIVKMMMKLKIFLMNYQTMMKYVNTFKGLIMKFQLKNI